MAKEFNPLIKGDLRTLVRVSLPLMLFLFCEGLAAFCERVFLSYCSLEAIHASVNATYLATFFQSPCTAIAFIAQVYVGLYQGSNQSERIGSCIWQLIWFSFLSFFLTFPLSQWASSLYFKDTAIEAEAISYFKILAPGNFFLPLNAALCSFYVGRGRTLFVTISMLGGYALDICLSWSLIFGVGNFLPALGTSGAPLAKTLSLASVSCIFFIGFLSKKNRKRYNTGAWHFSPRALWYYMRAGTVRALAYLMSKGCWVAITYILIKRGGEYLDILTVGGTVITFLLFIPSGIYKAVLTLAANLLGGRKEGEIVELRRSFIFYVGLIGVVVALPLIVFPNTFLYLFDKSVRAVFERTFGEISFWIWLYVLVLTIQLCFCALIVAARNLKIQLICYLFLWPISFVPVYIGFYIGNWDASKLWMLMLFENLAHLFVYLTWLRQKRARLHEAAPF